MHSLYSVMGRWGLKRQWSLSQPQIWCATVECLHFLEFLHHSPTHVGCSSGFIWIQNSVVCDIASSAYICRPQNAICQWRLIHCLRGTFLNNNVDKRSILCLLPTEFYVPVMSYRLCNTRSESSHTRTKILGEVQCLYLLVSKHFGPVVGDTL